MIKALIFAAAPQASLPLLVLAAGEAQAPGFVEALRPTLEARRTRYQVPRGEEREREL